MPLPLPLHTMHYLANRPSPSPVIQLVCRLPRFIQYVRQHHPPQWQPAVSIKDEPMQIDSNAPSPEAHGNMVGVPGAGGVQDGGISAARGGEESAAGGSWGDRPGIAELVVRRLCEHGRLPARRIVEEVLRDFDGEGDEEDEEGGVGGIAKPEPAAVMAVLATLVHARLIERAPLCTLPIPPKVGMHACFVCLCAWRGWLPCVRGGWVGGIVTTP
jgi:hypothetical protein